MRKWTEEQIRKAASWKAMKEGKALWSSGAVSAALATDGGWSGSVVSGRRPVRVAVVWKSASDVTCRCGCPANQSTGEFCEHAVAVGLSLLEQPDGSSRSVASATAPLSAIGPAHAWSVRVAANWQQSLQAGALSVCIQRADRAAGLVDERLGGWLAAHDLGQGPPWRLHLRGLQLASFLEVVELLPDLAVEGGGGFQVVCGRSLRVLDAIGDEGQLVLVVRESGKLINLADGFAWWLEELGVRRVGRGRVSSVVARGMEVLLRQRELKIPVSELLARLEEWQEWVEFEDGGWVRGLTFAAAQPQMRLELDGGHGRVRARLRVRYDDGLWLQAGVGELEGYPRVGGDCCWVRHRDAELAALEWMIRAGFTPESTGDHVLTGEQAFAELVADRLSSLPPGWECLETASFAAAKSRIQVLRPRFRAHALGEDGLDLNLSFETIDGKPRSMDEVASLLRGKGGSKVIFSKDWKQTFEPLLEELGEDLNRCSWRLRGVAADIFQEISKKYGKSIISNDQEILINAPICKSFETILRPYQRQGVEWMWRRLKRHQGVLLADDMGLGKTLQTIVLVEGLLSEDPEGVALVVMTASLLGNWVAEWKKFAPGRELVVMHGSGRDALRGRVGPGVVVVTTYSTLGRDLAWHLGRTYRVVVADEASLMRNPDTDLAKAMFKLQASMRVALSGTPIENGVRDLWSIFRFVQPGWLGPRKVFEERYAVAERLPAPVVERLRWRISPFVLRRTKQEVAPELPAKWVIDEYCELTDRQRALYRDLLQEGRGRVEALRDARQAGAARLQVLTLLLRLRQVCGDPALLDQKRFGGLPVEQRSGKLQRLFGLLEEVLEGGHKVLVFSQFREQLLRIEELIRERAWACLRLDGGTVDRQDLVDRFQAEGGPPIFLISLKAGGYGLNLTAADTVIHVDPWWNPAVEAQATDRAHRIGQVRPVTVYRLLTRDTVEQKVVSMQERKRGLSVVVDEAGEEIEGNWSFEELEGLLGG